MVKMLINIVLVKALIEDASHNALFSSGGQKGRSPGK